MKSLLIALATTTLLALAAGPAYAATASLTLPASTISQDGTLTVTVGINTQGASTIGSDLVIHYDHTLLQFQSANFTSPYAQNLTTTDTDIIKLKSTFITGTDSYTGSTNIATLTFKPLAAGSTSLAFVCQADATNDTNIWEQFTGEDIISCSSLSSSSLTITASSNNQDNTNNNDSNNNDNNSNDSSSNPTDDNGSSSSPNCPIPPTPINFKSAPNTKDSILLSWDHVPDTDHYSLMYGTSPGSYIYGISNIGYTNIFLVEYLKPATTYYFALKSLNTCGGASAAITTSTKTLGSSGNTTTTKPTPVPSGVPKTSTLASITTKSTTAKPVAELLDEPLKPTPTPEPTSSSPAGQTYQSPEPKLNLTKILIFFIPLIFAAIAFIIYTAIKKRRASNDSPDLDLDIKENILPSDSHYSNYPTPKNPPTPSHLDSKPPTPYSPSPTYHHTDLDHHATDHQSSSTPPSSSKSEDTPPPAASTLPNSDPLAASDLTKTHLEDQ